MSAEAVKARGNLESRGSEERIKMGSHLVKGVSSPVDHLHSIVVE